MRDGGVFICPVPSDFGMMDEMPGNFSRLAILKGIAGSHEEGGVIDRKSVV